MTSRAILVLLGATALTSTASNALAQSAVSEIVVTAQKREQNLQEVPASVTALPAESLKVARVQNVGDLDALSPNLTIQAVPGGSAVPVYSMRGVIASATAPGADKGVAIYIDGVYLGAGSGSMFNLADIERVEVLKGPQGTLFGRNSTGGAISFTTRGPKGEFAVKGEATLGNYDQKRFRVRVDSPQMGPLSAAVTYTHSERRGDIRNLGGGTVWDYSRVGGPSQVVSPNWLGNDNTDAIAASVKFDISPNFDLVYKFDHTNERASEVGVGVTRIMLPTLIAIQAASPNPTPISLTRPDAVNNWFTVPDTLRARGHILTANWRVTDQLTLKNILARRTNAYFSPGNELSGLGGLRNTISALGPVGAPLASIVTHSAGRDQQFSDELLANYDTDFMHLTAGGLWWRHTIQKGQYGTANNTDSIRVMPNFVILPPAIPTHQSRVTTRSKALYGQAEIHVTKQVDVVGGARYTHDKKTGVDATIATPILVDFSKGEWTYNAGVTFKPTDDILLYGKYATGYISGGELATLTFNTERAKSWEAGAKSEWFDHKLRANLALFSAKYTDLQFSGSGSAFGVPQASQVLVNAGDAKAKGFELETTAVPIDRLTLGANVGYLDFKFTRLDPRYVAAGNSVAAQRPKWTANLSAQYETPPVFGDAHVSFRIDGNYKSGHNGSGNPTLRDYTYIPTAWLVNGRVALEDIDVAGHKASVAVWARNLTNEDGIKYALPLGVDVGAAYEPARTVGVDLTVEY